MANSLLLRLTLNDRPYIFQIMAVSICKFREVLEKSMNESKLAIAVLTSVIASLLDAELCRPNSS